MEALSAIPFWLLPDAPLFGEAVLVAAMFALAAVFTLYAARRLTASWWIALLVVAIEVVILPRTYSYPKILAYAAGFLAMWRYVGAPVAVAVVQLAVAVVVAFGLRYDHGIYVGIGGLLTVVMVSMPAGRIETMRKVTAFIGAVLLLLAPYLVYLEVHEGLWRHLMRGADLQAVESSRGRTIPAFTFGAGCVSNAVPWLFFVFHLAAARRGGRRVAAVAPSVRMRGSARWWCPHRGGGAGESRVDPRHALGASARCRRVAVAAARMAAGVRDAIAGVAAAAPDLGDRRVHSSRSRWRAPPSSAPRRSTWTRPRCWGVRSGLGSRSLARSPSFTSAFRRRRCRLVWWPRLVPFLDTSIAVSIARDHILIPGFAPEVTVWSRRPFAGGQVWFQPELLADDEDHRLVMSRLQGQRVPVAVLLLSIVGCDRGPFSRTRPLSSRSLSRDDCAEEGDEDER